MAHQKAIVLDYGVGDAQTIAREIRALHVYCEVKPADITLDTLLALSPMAIVQSSGSPAKASYGDLPVLQKGENMIDFFANHGFTYDWTTQSYIDQQIDTIRRQVGTGNVLCALSGGVDSSVAAALVHKAVGNQLTCVFVDHGMMRKNEPKEVLAAYKQLGLQVIACDAADRFLGKLAGVADPETKRKIIGTEFIRLFEEQARKLGKVDFLVQGTIYPDVIESGVGAKHVKAHHNVGGLPADMDLLLLEPLRELFKDEVRLVGEALGLPSPMVWRQPFPGPGLGVRCLGEITRERLAVLREADAILREEIALAHLDRTIWQYFAILPPFASVGLRDGARTYAHTIILRAVHSVDAMTANWAHIPFDTLQKISTRITDQLPEVNRVAYDITSKPPATIEWE